MRPSHSRAFKPNSLPPQHLRTAEWEWARTTPARLLASQTPMPAWPSMAAVVTILAGWEAPSRRVKLVCAATSANATLTPDIRAGTSTRGGQDAARRRAANRGARPGCQLHTAVVAATARRRVMPPFWLDPHKAISLQHSRPNRRMGDGWLSERLESRGACA